MLEAKYPAQERAMSAAAVGMLSPYPKRSQSTSCSGDKGMHASSIIAHNAFSWTAFLSAVWADIRTTERSLQCSLGRHTLFCWVRKLLCSSIAATSPHQPMLPLPTGVLLALS
jgi:hypothetical protein